MNHFILSIYFGLELLTKIVKWLTFLSAIFELVIITYVMNSTALYIYNVSATFYKNLDSHLNHFLLQLLSLTHIKFLINLNGPFMHGVMTCSLCTCKNMER
jgi:hypothetical protein